MFKIFDHYNISDRYKNILNLIHEEEELTEDHLELLRAAGNAFEHDAIEIASGIENFKAEADMIEGAIEKLKKRAASLRKKENKLVEYLRSAMESMGMSHINGAFFDLKIKKNPPSVILNIEPEFLDIDYRTEKTIYQADKKAIKSALTNGIEIKGAHLQESTRLEIKVA